MAWQVLLTCVVVFACCGFVSAVYEKQLQSRIAIGIPFAFVAFGSLVGIPISLIAWIWGY